MNLLCLDELARDLWFLESEQKFLNRIIMFDAMWCGVGRGEGCVGRVWNNRRLDCTPQRFSPDDIRKLFFPVPPSSLLRHFFRLRAHHTEAVTSLHPSAWALIDQPINKSTCHCAIQHFNIDMNIYVADGSLLLMHVVEINFQLHGNNLITCLHAHIPHLIETMFGRSMEGVTTLP